MNLHKCLDRRYLDFLVFLHGMELSNFKVYDMFSAIRRGEIDLDYCYKFLAGLYGVLERSLGDPQLALYKLSISIPGTKLADFLRGYGNVLLTSGDTLSYVSEALRSEFASLRARINELLKSVEVLYEATLVAVLGIALLSVLPLWPLPHVVGVITLQSIGLIGYFMSAMIARQMYYTLDSSLVFLDLLFLLSLGAVCIFTYYGLLASVLLLVVTRFTMSKHVKRLEEIERSSLRTLNEVHSRVALGNAVDLALLDTLKSSPLVEFRLIWYSFLNGLKGTDILRNLTFPVLASKVFSILGNLAHYSSPSSTYTASILQFVDEIENLRKYVREKAKYYVLYSGLVSALMAASYIMITRMPLIIATNTSILGIYGYVSTISTAVPAGLLTRGTFTLSNTAILAVAIASIILLTISTGIL